MSVLYPSKDYASLYSEESTSYNQFGDMADDNWQFGPSKGALAPTVGYQLFPSTINDSSNDMSMYTKEAFEWPTTNDTNFDRLIAFACFIVAVYLFDRTFGDYVKQMPTWIKLGCIALLVVIIFFLLKMK